jgi:hypothetical protein
METNVVYGAGLVQGVVLVTFPAASTIFTDPSRYALSSTQYVFMFLPQVLTAIAAALLGGSLARRLGTKRVYLLGLAANLASMALLIASQFLVADRALSYGLLLAATACLGAGFGLTVPALNTLIAGFHPDAVDTSGAGPERPSGGGDGARPGVRRASSAWAPGGASHCRRRSYSPSWSAPVWGCRCAWTRAPAAARGQPVASRRASGCSRRSPCATGSARP